MTDDLLDSSLESSQRIKLNYRPLIIWGILLFFGFMFRVMHWPFASILILIPSAGITSYSICKLAMITKGKSPVFIIFAMLGILWICVMLFGIAFNDGHPYNSIGLTVHVVAILVLSAIYVPLNFAQIKKAKAAKVK